MNEVNKSYFNQHIDILSFRDLAPGTVATYTSYMTQFLDWSESTFAGKSVPDITWEELRSYIRFLKDMRQMRVP